MNVTGEILGSQCPECGLPRLADDDLEHGRLEICLNPGCEYDTGTTATAPEASLCR